MWNQNICGIISRKVNWRGSILSYHVGILIPAIFLFWRHLHQRLFYMSMETMTINMKGFHRKAASALTIKYMCMKECASWDLAVPCDINRENINIPVSYTHLDVYKRQLDNSDHKLPVDYNEVTVTRRLYRSGESEYLINGSGCRLKDIQEMFYDTGIGKEGYSIIGQGPVSYTHLAVNPNL